MASLVHVCESSSVSLFQEMSRAVRTNQIREVLLIMYYALGYNYAMLSLTIHVTIDITNGFF